jgi:hypothetical protein
MSFPPTTQTIWEGDEYGDGTTRRIQARGDGSYIALDRAVLDGKYWHQTTMFVIKNREQAIAVRMAIDTYLETPPAPTPAAWPLMQAADLLVDHCKTYPHYGSEWGRRLIEEADRVAALIDWVAEPIEPVPPRGGNPIKYDAKHIAAPNIDLIVEFGSLATLDNPVWVVSDEFGEEIVVTLMGLDWLAELLPRVLESYRSGLKLHE